MDNSWDSLRAWLVQEFVFSKLRKDALRSTFGRLLPTGRKKGHKPIPPPTPPLAGGEAGTSHNGGMAGTTHNGGADGRNLPLWLGWGGGETFFSYKDFFSF